MADEHTSAENQLWLEKIYIRDVRFVATDPPERYAPAVDAEAQLNVQSSHQEIKDDFVEVTLILRVKSMLHETELFRIELAQAGVFTVTGFAPEEREHVLGATCPGMLYPFARQVVADTVKRSGFSELLLRPLDFDTMYVQNVRQRPSTDQPKYE